ncbi:tripeptidyl peptidase sed3 [Diplodia corticola]|uniref:tripeptidyl-peptidase II n=1 Tax=Diplodia corticola TaxID=236234 RepID=A0A1J9QUP1_9PEZI|nr:tripeptidyl peptidase sed3 [Diplodia corticola]OJD31690.1 tripeptidyl peptidase sed3 [Diplodia corticola]
MRAATVFAGLLSVVATVNCFSFSATELFEKLREVPESWTQVGSPDPAQKLRFMIAVKQPNHALFEQTLLDISTPGSANYGKHLKRDELKNMLRPEAKATDSIIAWLETSGIESEAIEDDGEWINFVATVSQAEKMMATKFNTYRSEIRKSVQNIRTLEYSIPTELHDFINMIQPTTRFAQIRPQRSLIYYKKLLDINALASADDVSASCNSTITPDCLKSLYNIEGYTPKANQTYLGVSGFLEEYARYDDLAQFIDTYAPAAKGKSFSFGSINGSSLPQDSSDDATEANLDIQYTLPLVYPLDVTYFYTSGRGPLVPDLDQPDVSSNEPYLEYFTELMKKPDSELPSTLSTSYGEDEQSVPASYARTICDMIGQLGSRGVSVIFSSGDTGPGSACQTNDGKNTTRFLPVFPASCPYATSVGGTYQIEPERAVSFSSGGFSDLWERPSWQNDTINKYLGILGDKWTDLYNPQGRGFPDVAAQGRQYRVVINGLQSLVGGTSASAPTFASIIALLNSARVEAGQAPLGWLNPWLYSTGKGGLTDIVDGTSTGCTGTDIFSGLPAPKVDGAGWAAVEGWDPVTGLGTPDFSRLLKLAVQTRYGGYRQK